MFEDISKVVLISDMDGTLLNSQKKITDTDRNAIERFMKLGGKFTIATGRTIQSFEQYGGMLDLRMPLIMYNGAAIFDWGKKQLLYSSPLTAEARRYTSEILEAMPQIGGEVLRTDGTYVFRNNEYQQFHTKICGIIPNYCDVSEIPDGGWLKVLFSMSPEDIPEIKILTDMRRYSNVSFVKSSEIFYEMLPLGITKGTALDEYRKLDGMTDYTFAAAGDFDNDIDMLIKADLGAAPANAEDIVKQSADIVLKNSCDTGAIAEFIDYIIEKCGENK